MISNKFIKAYDEYCDFDKHVNAPYFRKKFNIEFVPQKAEITICGLGFYKLYINGTEITKGPLAPYISNADDLCYYDTYDVSDNLCKGENVIGIILGNGFFNAFGGFVWDFEKAKLRGPLRLALHFCAEDSENKLEFEADESFKVHESPILFDDLRMGMQYDARLEIPEWNLPGFDDISWKSASKAETPRGEAKICEAEPIKVRKEIKPVSIKHFDELYYCKTDSSPAGIPDKRSLVKDVYMFDFGVNDAGVCKIKIKGERGQKVTLRHCEHLVNGEFNINTIIFYRPATEKDTIDTADRYIEYSDKIEYILKGDEEEIFVPDFTYQGFRYVLVEGLKKEQATTELLTYEVMSGDFKERAKFSCSDDVTNKLFEITRRSDLANFFYFPTDCPHREKNGWTGDASVSSEHMLINFDCLKSYKEWMKNIQKAQKENGQLPGIIPTYGWGFKWGNGPAWDSVCVNIPYYSYKYNGDVEILSENADLVFKYLNYISQKRDKSGLIHIGLGDWCQPGRKSPADASSPLEFTDSAITYDIAKKASFIFDILGLKLQKNFADELANDLKKSIRTNLINFDTMTVIGECQTSQALAIYYKIFEESEIKEAFKVLIDIIHNKNDDHLDCGMIGLRYIFRTLADYGEADLAYKMITRSDWPSYGGLIAEGATSLWETFFEKDKKYDSCNHHFFGDISYWFIRYIAGIRPNPNLSDISQFEISPRFIEKIDNVSSEYISVYGNIEVKWKRDKEAIILNVKAPKEIKGNIILTGGYKFTNNSTVMEIASGEYKIAKN